MSASGNGNRTFVAINEKLAINCKRLENCHLFCGRAEIFFIDAHLTPQVFQTRERTVDNQDRLLDLVLLELVMERNICQKGVN